MIEKHRRRSPRRSRSIITAMVSSAVGLGLAASPAVGHVVSQQLARYHGQSKCVVVRGEISHSGGGYNLSKTILRVDDSACGSATSTDQGNLQTKFENYRDGALCTYMVGWATNTSSGSSVTASSTNAAVCGGGSYRTYGYGNWWNGGWFGTGNPGSGNPVNSGAHSTPF